MFSSSKGNMDGTGGSEKEGAPSRGRRHRGADDHKAEEKRCVQAEKTGEAVSFLVTYECATHDSSHMICI
jgi:hypothetical protein